MGEGEGNFIVVGERELHESLCASAVKMYSKFIAVFSD